MIIQQKATLELHNNIVDLTVFCENSEEALELHHALRAMVDQSRLNVEFTNLKVAWDQIYK